MTNVSFSGNHGGDLWVAEAAVIDATTFSGCSASYGCLYVDDGATVGIGNSRFQQALDGRGAIYASNQTSMAIANTSFIANTGSYGAAITIGDSGDLSIINGLFFNNQDTSALYGAGTIIVEHSAFVHNDGNRGAVWLHDAPTVTFNETVFHKNTGSYTGGINVSGTLHHHRRSV